jgi:hypothetical protein
VSELDLLNLARSTTEHEVSWFAQMITINFGMVVAIYYFLHRAKLVLRVFSFLVYSVGMLVLLGEMLVEANVKAGVMESMRALPSEHLSRPTVHYLAVYDSCPSGRGESAGWRIAVAAADSWSRPNFSNGP